MAPAGANSVFFALPHTLPLVYTLGYSPNFWDGREKRSGILLPRGGRELYQLTGGVVARVPGSSVLGPRVSVSSTRSHGASGGHPARWRRWVCVGACVLCARRCGISVPHSRKQARRIPQSRARTTTAAVGWGTEWESRSTSRSDKPSRVK